MPGGSDLSGPRTAIRIEGLSKGFGGTAVLRDLTLEVRPGELLALLGPSGSGKTTLLRAIAGLDVPDRGRILFDGEDATALPVQLRSVGFVFQHYALFRHMSVAANIAYGLGARPRRERPAKAEIARRVEALLDLMGLSGFGGRRPSQLSGGQRQRVALARALAVEPRVLLLDEPFGALDAQVRKGLRRWLREIHDRVGQTTIFVTHDHEEAIEICDRIAILDKGRLAQLGPPDEIQAHPASATVLRFLGDAIALDAVVEQGRILVGGRPTPVTPPEGASGPITLYVRPWQVRLAPEGQAHLAGIVRSSHGRQGRQRVEIEHHGSVIAVELAETDRAAAGHRIGLSIAAGHAFPEE